MKDDSSVTLALEAAHAADAVTSRAREELALARFRARWGLATEDDLNVAVRAVVEAENAAIRAWNTVDDLLLKIRRLV